MIPYAPAGGLVESRGRACIFCDGCAIFIQQYPYSPGVETYTEARPLVSHFSYDSDRMRALEGLRAEISKGSIDEPTMDIVEQFARIPYCYTLQSCYGHFMVEPSREDRNTKRVVDIGGAGTILHYRIAYVAFCIQNSARGRTLLEELSAIVDTDPEYIQFGSADWFWDRCVNSYVLQVSPLRNAFEDHFDVNMEEAFRIEEVRDEFFDRLRAVLLRNRN